MFVYKPIKWLVVVFLAVSGPAIFGYSEPYLGLGFSNILDGGPIRPNPGWYLLQYNAYYHTNNFLDCAGEPLGCVPSPELNAFATVFGAAYQSDTEVFLKGKWGVEASLPLVLYSKINRNLLDITTDGEGFGDLGFGAYLQWDPIMFHGRAIFVHRLEFSATFPTGKNSRKERVISPGNNIFFTDPYWAATAYFTRDWSLSWRLSFVLNSTNQATHIKAGNATYLNYSFQHQFSKNLWLAVTGYYLRQLQDDKLYGKYVPNTKEQVFAVGPGLLYYLPGDVVFFSYLYFERLVSNRPQATSFIFRFVKSF